MRSTLAFLYRALRLHRVDNRILLYFLVFAAAAFAFVNLASEVMEGDTLAFDRWLLRALRSAADPAVPVGPGWLQDSMLDITALGGVAVLTIISIFAVGYLLAVRKAGMAMFLIGATAGGAIVSVCSNGVSPASGPTWSPIWSTSTPAAFRAATR